jgi:uncharacterized protein
MHRILLCVFIIVLFASCASLGGPPATKFFLDPQVRRLAEAAASGDTAELERLVSAGVSVNATGRGRLSPALWALLHQNKKGLAFLLAKGANPNVQLTEDFDELLIEGVSTMSYAARHEDSWYLKEVLKHGGDANLVNHTRSHTPILDSIFSSRTENAKLLISAGANLNWQDRNGATPLMAAAMLGQYDLVYEMLDAGADPTLTNKWGYSILYDINHMYTGRAGPQAQWRQKVIDRLRAKGIDTENGR